MDLIPVINEGATGYLTVEFWRDESTLAIPAEVCYRIDCLTNDTSILGETALALSESQEIILSNTDNRILDEANPFERRLLTVEIVDGEGSHSNKTFEWTVRNLYAVTGVPA